MRTALFAVAAGLLLSLAGRSAARDDKEDLAILVKDLASKTEKTRLAAVQSLAALGPRAAPVLKDVCDRVVDKSPKVSVAALEAVEKIDPDLYKPLSGYLLDGKAQDRAKAIFELKKLGEKARPASAVFVSHLRSALDTLPVSKGAEKTRARTAAHEAVDVIAAVQPDDHDAVATMKRAAGAGCPDMRVRLTAVEYLVKWAGTDAERRKEVVPILGAGLSGDKALAAQCAQYAGSYGSAAKSLLPVLKQLTQSPDMAVRNSAIVAVEKIDAKP